MEGVNSAGGEFANLAGGGGRPRRARKEGFASVYYTAFNALTVGFEAKFVNGREDIGFPAPDFLPKNFDLGGYTLLRLLADYEFRHGLHVYGRVENLGDENYQEVYGYPALRRGFFGGFSARF